jgi:hypothetical protein
MRFDLAFSTNDQIVELRQALLLQIFLKGKVSYVLHDILDKNCGVLSHNVFGTLSWSLISEKVDLQDHKY